MRRLEIKMSHGEAATWFPAVILAIVFLSLSLPRLHAPPPNAEETCESLEAVRALTRSGDQLPPWLGREEAYLRFGDRALPLMEDNSYVGAIELYMQLPLFAVFGVNPFALRLLPILAGLAALLASFVVCRRWFGGAAALVASMMAATHPFVIHYGRLGHQMEEIFTTAFFWLGVLCIDRYVRSAGERVVALCVGMALFGVGISHKIDFLWYLIGMGAVAIVFGRRLVAAWPPRLSHTLAGAAAFLVGCGPILLYNTRTAGSTFRTMAHALVTPTAKDGIDNLHYGANLLVRLKQFLGGPLQGALQDPAFDGLATEQPLTFNHLFAGLFVVGFVVVPVLAVRGRLPFDRTRVLAVFILFCAVFAVSPFTVSGFFPNHLLVMFPFAQLVVALLLVGLPILSGGHRFVVWISRILAVAVLVLNLYLTVHHHVDMADTAAPGMTPWTTIRQPGTRPVGFEPVIPLDDRW